MKKTRQTYDFIPEIHSKHRVFKFIIITGLIFSIVFTSYVFFRTNLETIIEKETNVYLDEVSDSNAETLLRKIDGDVNLLKGLALMLGQLDTIDMNYWITVFDNDSLFENFQRVAFVFDGKGYGTDFYGIDFTDREYVKQGMKGESYVSDVVYDKVTQKPMVIYITPILKNNEIIGLIGFGIFIEEYQKLLEVTSFGELGYSYVVDHTGKMIVYSDHHDSIRGVENIFDALNQNDQQIISMKENMRQGIDGKISFQNVENSEKLMLYKPLMLKDWYLLTVIPEEISMQKSIAIQNLTLIFSGIVVLLFTAVIIFYFYEQKKHRQELSVLAYVDELTGFANKNSFIHKASTQLKKGPHRYAFIALDIDKFKLINDLFGYSQGDLVLKHIAHTIRTTIGADEAFGRVSADQFNILLKYETKSTFEERLDQMLADMVNYHLVADANFKLIVKAGIYVISNTGSSIHSISDLATLAKDKIKGSHETGYYYYNDDIRNKVVEESEIEQAMEKALENREFQVFLQPKYDLKTEQISGAEALVRWLHPKKGMLPPAVFIPIFERNGFVTKLDMFVLEEIFKMQKSWLDQGKNIIPISVNQSRLHMYNPLYIEQLKQMSETYQHVLDFIELELTESIFSSDIQTLKKITNSIHELGFKLEIDDFGSGYSSLNMLKDIKVDVIKLDREFLLETTDSVRGRKIVESIIAMAKDLGIQTVAEGVEFESQVNFLRSVDCDYAQGYYYAKPMPITDFETLLHEEA